MPSIGLVEDLQMYGLLSFQNDYSSIAQGLLSWKFQILNLINTWDNGDNLTSNPVSYF
jgi:hypothetical protein